ncbi:hypothetical protein [Salinibius halmophilus]|uniref:hypothetical protein n=1 Tax=Salinibius halmophilus TaxID=1853216 RepID=UPI000E668BF3|nr:hypothetical protein [Salinibius halmophilus]
MIKYWISIAFYPVIVMAFADRFYSPYAVNLVLFLGAIFLFINVIGGFLLHTYRYKTGFVFAIIGGIPFVPYGLLPIVFARMVCDAKKRAEFVTEFERGG